MNLAKFKRMNPAISRHKRITKKFKRNYVISPGLYTTLFADLCLAYSKSKYYRKNRNKKYILVVVDGLSRQAFTRAMTTKTAEECAQKLDSIFESLVNLPGHTFFVTDRGGEFMSQKYITPLMKHWGFTTVPLQGTHKASMAERFM